MALHMQTNPVFLPNNLCAEWRCGRMVAVGKPDADLGFDGEAISYNTVSRRDIHHCFTYSNLFYRIQFERILLVRCVGAPG